MEREGGEAGGRCVHIARGCFARQMSRAGGIGINNIFTKVAKIQATLLQIDLHCYSGIDALHTLSYG